LAELAAEIVYQNTLTEEEAEALKWAVRNSKKPNGPKSCEWCKDPSQRGYIIDDPEARKQNVENLQDLYGCRGEPAINPVRNPSGYEFQTCPQAIVNRSHIGEYFRAYGWLDAHGILPFGELWEQSEKFVRAIEVIRYEIGAIEKEQLEEQQRKANKPQRGGKSSPFARRK